MVFRGVTEGSRGHDRVPTESAGYGGRWSRMAREAPPFGVSVRMARGATLGAERRELLARPRQVGVAGPPGGQLEHPLAGRANQLAGDGEHAAPERLRPL